MWANQFIYSLVDPNWVCYTHCPECLKYQCLFFNGFSPNTVRPFNSHTRVLSQFRTCFFHYVFDYCILRPSINFVGQISIVYPSYLSFSHSFILFLNVLILLSTVSILISTPSSHFNCSTALDFLTMPQRIHLPSHLTCCFYISECLILVAFCFCFREYVL